MLTMAAYFQPRGWWDPQVAPPVQNLPATGQNPWLNLSGHHRETIQIGTVGQILIVFRPQTQ